jgi:hypothetical protein
LLDVLLDPNARLLPDGLRGKLDAQRVGIVGHSIGSITTGQFTWGEKRVKASVFIAAPPTVPLLTPASLAGVVDRCGTLRVQRSGGHHARTRPWLPCPFADRDGCGDAEEGCELVP